MERIMNKPLLCAVVSFAAFLMAPVLAAPASAPAKSSVVVFRLSGELTESPSETGGISLFGEEKMSLAELIQRMNKAAKDSNVKAVVVLAQDSAVGTAQAEELRQAMKGLRDAGKDVYVHADSLDTREFVLSAGASRLSVVPTADVWVTGLYSESPYVRGLLDMIGVKPDYLTCGDYKSASEIFMRKGPSPEAERMTNWLLDGIYDTYLNLIASGRKVDKEQAKKWIDDGPYSAETAKAAGLIDAIEQRQQFEQMLREKYGQQVAFEKKYGEKPQPTIDFSSPFAIFKIFGEAANKAKSASAAKPAVGIVYVDGPIVLGKGEASLMGGSSAASTDIRKALDQAAADDSIKAVVLRVDSPGGSAVASEIILDATRRVKDKKPLIVSMGNVAGSGGYYVTCASDTVFADESTITGSIGVVGGKFATNDAWNHLGITFKSYQRGKNAGLLSSDHTFTPEERQRMQQWMDDVYNAFKKHVTDSRGSKLKKPLDEMAGGRVYTGKQALDLGLIDKIGTLHDALAFAAAQAKLGEDFEVRVVPEPQNFMEKIIEQLSGKADDDEPMHVQMGISLLEAAMPQLRGLDPVRLQSVKAAICQLQLMQQERVLMAMPVITIRN
jgi:protease-4